MSQEATKTRSEKECYFDSLQKWVDMANLSQKATTNFPYFLLANYPQLFQASSQLGAETQTPNVPNVNEARPDGFRAPFDNMFNNQARMDAIIASHGGYEFVIAPSWKRILAETIDILILMFIKLMVTFTVIDLFDFDL